MKIWYQSSAALGKDPLWRPYEEQLNKHISSAAGDNIEIEVHGLDVVSSAIEKSHYLAYINAAKWLENARKAEKEGYGAFIVGCMHDPAFLPLREIVDIPIVFAGETSFLFACSMAHRFSLLSPDEAQLIQAEERLRECGLGERYIPGTSCGIEMDELRDGFADRSLVAKVKEKSKKAIGRGAGLLVPTCNILAMFLDKWDVREIDGLPVQDNVTIMVKTAEMLVELKKTGTGRSKRGFYSGFSPREIADLDRRIGRYDKSRKRDAD